jgi:hypothetical protein
MLTGQGGPLIEKALQGVLSVLGQPLFPGLAGNKDQFH